MPDICPRGVRSFCIRYNECDSSAGGGEFQWPYFKGGLQERSKADLRHRFAGVQIAGKTKGGVDYFEEVQVWLGSVAERTEFSQWYGLQFVSGISLIAER